MQGYIQLVCRENAYKKYTLVSVLQMRMLGYNPHRSRSKMLLSVLVLPVAPLPQMKTEFWVYNYTFAEFFSGS